MSDNAEARRLEESEDPHRPWKKWGPRLSERQWGTVREDYRGRWHFLALKPGG